MSRSPDPASVRASADLQALDLVEAATLGRQEFIDAWARVHPDAAGGVLAALDARVVVDNLVRNTPLTPGAVSSDLGCRAARAAFHVAGALVADSIERDDPLLVPRRLRTLRASARDAPAVERYARQMTCEPDARQVGAAILAAVREHRTADARYLVRTTSRDLAEAVLHVTIDALADLLVAAGMPSTVNDLPERLRAEMALVRGDLWTGTAGPLGPSGPVVLDDALVVADGFAQAALGAPDIATRILDRLRNDALQAT